MKFIHLVLFFCLSLNATQASAFTFKIATISPDGSYWMQRMRAGAKHIEEQTSGRVKFKFYPGGVMGDSKGVLRKIRLRQLHGAALTNSSLSDVYPDIQLYNLILQFNSLDEVDAIRKQMDPVLKQGLEDNGYVTFGIAEVGMVYLMSTSPVQTFDQLLQQKVWVPSQNSIAIEAMKAFGISPIPLPLRDVLMGLQTGMINVAAAPPTGALALQWHTKIKYVTDYPLMYGFGLIVLDQKAFKRISPEDQTIVRTVMGQISDEIDKHSRQNNLDAIAALKQQGVDFLTLDDPTIQRLIETSKKANQNIEQNSGLSKDKIAEINQMLNQLRHTAQ